MKRRIIPIIFLTVISGMTLRAQENNNFYDDAETVKLQGAHRIEVTGEVVTPGFVDFDSLSERSINVKEAFLDGNSNKFTGAYRYDGYSLFDILNHFLPDKLNKEEFPPIIDLYVEVRNDQGESVILTWGEIYYPIHLHEIIIATSVMRIVPSKTKELWPLPEKTKLVAGHDLLTERNISSPTKIIVHSASRSFEINRDLNPLFCPSIVCNAGGKKVAEIKKLPKNVNRQHYESVFYGRGRGIHSTTPFDGVLLKDVLGSIAGHTTENLRKGYFIVAAADGYRAVYSYSELFNRNDQAEFLLTEDQGKQDGGAFRIFPAADFFSDRAVKAVSEIYFEVLK
jgi:hypothetical protein